MKKHTGNIQMEGLCHIHRCILTYRHIPYINVYSNSMVSSVKGYLFWNMHCVIVSPCKWRVMTSNTEFRLGPHIVKAWWSMQEIWNANAACKANVRTTIRRHDDTMRRTYTVFTKTHKEMTHAFCMHNSRRLHNTTIISSRLQQTSTKEKENNAKVKHRSKMTMEN